MPIETYIPSEVSYAGHRLEEVFVCTLYDPDSDTPYGSLTTANPLPEGQRGGPLVVAGTRDKQQWRVTLAEIEVYRKTAVGCEYLIFGALQRQALGPAASAVAASVNTDTPPRIENLGATF
jgi:hypothetical protein